MPAKPPYGVLAVTGGGSHQEDYARGFAADPRCRVIGVTDERDVNERRARLNRKLADEMKVPLLPDLDEALKRPDVHIVSVCTEHERQGRVALRAVEAGKHLYVDKPMAGSLGDADRIVAALRQRGLRGQMFSQVNQGYALHAKRIVDSGRLGELKAIHCDLMFCKGWPGGAPLGRKRKEAATPTNFLHPDAKREMFNIAVYSIAMIRWMTKREILSVYSTTSNYFFEEHYKRDFEDFGMIALTLQGGLTATMTAGRIGWMSHLGGGPNLTRLYGSKGSVLIDRFQPRAEFASDIMEWKRPSKDPDDPMCFWRSTQDRQGVTLRPEWMMPDAMPAKTDQSMFVDCVEQGREAEVSVYDAAKVLEALFAAYRSAASGEVIKLPLPR
ncbi:MAG: Gfo/Idh/MocA family protein [Bryobacteraceae bacterium]